MVDVFSWYFIDRLQLSNRNIRIRWPGRTGRHLYKNRKWCLTECVIKEDSWERSWKQLYFRENLCMTELLSFSGPVGNVCWHSWGFYNFFFQVFSILIFLFVVRQQRKRSSWQFLSVKYFRRSQERKVKNDVKMPKLSIISSTLADGVIVIAYESAVRVRMPNSDAYYL